MNTAIQTYTGTYFDVEDFEHYYFRILDIAHALSNLCRYTGHTIRFYSVAQHSILVAEQLPQSLKLTGLLHDASEAYIHDIPRPHKHLFPRYTEIEGSIMAKIMAQFGGIWPLPSEVKYHDNVLLVTEKRDLMLPTNRDDELWNLGVEPLSRPIGPWSPEVAMINFLSMFQDIRRD